MPTLTIGPQILRAAAAATADGNSDSWGTAYLTSVNIQVVISALTEGSLVNLFPEVAGELAVADANWQPLPEKNVDGLAAVGNTQIVISRTDGLSRWLRVRYTVGGAETPSVTFGLTATGQEPH